MIRRAARIAGTLSIGVGVLLLVWAFVIWQWNDPFTSLYTRWEQRMLESRFEKAVASFPKSVVKADFEEAGDDDVFRKIRADFDAKSVAQSDHQIRRTMDELLGTAIDQIKAAG